MKSFHILSCLSAEEISELQSSARLYVFDKQKSLSIGGKKNAVYLVCRGMVKLFRENAIDYLKFIYKKGELVGLLPLFGHRESDDFQLQAVDEATVVQLNANLLQKYMITNAEFLATIHHLVSIRTVRAENHVKFLHSKDIADRIFYYLSDLVVSVGHAEKDFYQMPNVVSHEELAQLCAVSRQTVTTVLNELRRDAVIFYDAHTIKIPKELVSKEVYYPD